MKRFMEIGPNIFENFPSATPKLGGGSQMDKNAMWVIRNPTNSKNFAKKVSSCRDRWNCI